MFQNHILDVDHIEEEIGDVMFYICNLATLLELNMETILEKNIKKCGEFIETTRVRRKLS